MQDNSVRPLRRILMQLRHYYPVILVYSVCISILTLATPISVQSLVNTFSFGPFFQPIFVLSVILFALLAVLGVLKSLQYLLAEYLQRKMYAINSTNMSRAYLLGDQLGSLEIDSKANRYFDIVLIHKNLTFLVTEGIAIALQTSLGLILISLYHPYFIILGLLIAISIVAPIYLWGQQALSSADNESTWKFKVADQMEQLASHKSSDLSVEDKLRKSDVLVKEYLSKRSSHFKTVFIQNVVYIILYAVLNALLLGLGGYLVISNQLSVGQLVAAEIVVNSILAHFLKANKLLEAFYDCHAGANKLEIFYNYLDSKRALSTSDIGQRPQVDPSLIESVFNQVKSIQSIYTPTNYLSILKKFVAVLVLLVSLLLITPWQQFSRGSGRVLAYNPNDRVQTITATVGGIVEDWLIQDGEFVEKGAPIVRVVDNDPDYLSRLESQRDAAIAKFEAAREASDTGRLNFRRQEKLVVEGLSSKKEFESAKINYKKLRAEEAAASAQLAKAETDFSRQQQQVIVAPRSGQVKRILLGSGTTNVKVGEALVEFVPNTDENAVELYLDGNDLPLVHIGRRVRLQFEGWPAVQFSGWPSIAIGSFGGVVSVVDPSVSANGTFRILVKPDPEDPVSWPEQNFLRQGTRTVGIVLLNEVSVGYEIWRQINGFPKSLKRSPKIDRKKERRR